MDPHSFFADPDPAVLLDADPDPAVLLDADPETAAFKCGSGSSLTKCVKN